MEEVPSVYELLADRLDAIPNGFPRTQSGVELRLLEKLFQPEEARLAAVMRLRPESASEIAQRAGTEPGETLQRLKEMGKRGLILARQKEGELRFGLMPWVVGIYEAQLTRMDEELAQLSETYFQEGFVPQALRINPPLHRVIPIEETVPTGIEIAPYDQVSRLLETARSFGVRDCICRVQRRLAGRGCNHPVENCLVFSHLENAFAEMEDEIRPLSREEAFQVLKEARDAGLVHTVNNVQDRHGYICNCCTCSCGLLRGISEFGILNAVARSAFLSQVDEALCTGCEECVDRCPFGALEVPDGLCRVNAMRCMGCGQCVLACPAEALHLHPRPLKEVILPPRDRTEWMVQRAKERGLSLRDIL